uniref:PDZ domain-containing protein n=1 Tax=Mesocestoides corti TaxID=53468 RepID=A0A5K3EUP3_MESCO
EYSVTDKLKLFCELQWIDVQARLLASELILTPLHITNVSGDLWRQFSQKCFGTGNSVIVRIQRKECCGLGVSIKGGREFGAPIIISKIFKVRCEFYFNICIIYSMSLFLDVI